MRPYVLLLSVACGPASVDDAVPAPPPDCSGLDREGCVAALRDAMTLAEKIEQMHGIGFAAVDGLYLTADNERLGIAGFRMVDGPRGVRAGNATAFPVGMARGASWDIDLERRVGEAIAMEAAAKGANVLLAPTMNLLRHPAWGRAQETYGEDPVHLGAMAVAFVEGAQKHLIASAKHFALNTLASILFGEVNPSGKLPITFPVDETQLPPFDHESFAVTYGYDHGYRLVDRLSVDPLFPFGFGLGYATFTYDALALSASTVGADDTIGVTVDVTNTSSRAGDEVVQAYVSYPGTQVERPLLALAAFARVLLAPGETKSVELTIPVGDLGYYDSTTQSFALEAGAHRVLVGPSSRDLPLEQSFIIR